LEEGHAVASAQLLLPGTLEQRMGITRLWMDLVDLDDRPGHHPPGRKVLTQVHALVVGP
jgi:hypothetical protein